MVIIKQQILSNKRSKLLLLLFEENLKLHFIVDLMVYIRVDLLLLCLANIILHFLILLEEYNSSNTLNYNSNRNEIMHSRITLYY